MTDGQRTAGLVSGGGMALVIAAAEGWQLIGRSLLSSIAGIAILGLLGWGVVAFAELNRTYERYEEALRKHGLL